MSLENAVPIKIKDITFSQEYKIDKEGNIYTPYRGWHKMSSTKTNNGYHRIGLMTIDKKRKMFQVHRLVLQTFSPIENPEKWQVNHKDGNKDNNSLKNLEWCDGYYNMQHGYDIGIHKPPYGERAGGNILKESEVLEICDLILQHNLSYREIGELYGVSKSAIYDIKRKKSWSWLTKDYIF